MKRLLILLTVLVILIGCSKENKTPMYNEDLVGKKFRAEAWYNTDGYGQVYEVLEFESDTEVISEYRLANNNPVNMDYRVVLNWRKNGSTGTSIIVNYYSFTDDKDDAKEIKGIVTDGIISFSGKTGATVFAEY